MPHPAPLLTVVSFFTPDYSADADRLAASLDEFKIPYKIDQIPTLGSWSLNTAYKATFLAIARMQLRGPLVWIDADAIVRSYPHEFDHLADPKKIAPEPYDIAVHFRRDKELLSGTIWINDTYGAEALLTCWQWEQRKRPNTWDQKTLAHVIQETGDAIKLYRLPPAYCFIHDLMRPENPGVEPVIEHFQASRRTRRRENQEIERGLF